MKQKMKQKELGWRYGQELLRLDVDELRARPSARSLFDKAMSHPIRKAGELASRMTLDG
jgi:hypothetical protein